MHKKIIAMLTYPLFNICIHSLLFITHCIALSTTQQCTDIINKIHVNFTETNHGMHSLSKVLKEGYGIVSFLLGQRIDFLFITQG